MTSAEGFDEFDMKLSEWRGYVVRALEDINKEQSLTNKHIENLEIKIDSLNDKITNLKVRVAEIGAGSGLIVSIVFFVLSKMYGS